MPRQQGFLHLPLLFLGLLVLVVALFAFQQKSNGVLPKVTPDKSLEIFSEKIPGSKFHSPDATWWGYNQSKIVRYKDLIFMYVIENKDDSNKTESSFVVYKKEGDNVWEKGASFSTSRPGNILVDSTGVLHAFVFEPFAVGQNDSWGKLKHYSFPESLKGNITNYQEEVVVDNDGKSETANIRVGAAIGKDGTMAVSFGLTKFNPLYNDQSEHVYYKKPGEEKWSHTYVDGLTHDYFYPFTLVSDSSFYLLPIQDDFTGQGNPNIYQKILFMEVKDGIWKSELIADLSNHPMATKKPRLLEQEDLYQDKRGRIHFIYKEFLDEKNDYAATAHWHVSGNPGNFKSKKLAINIPGVNWVRLIDVDGDLYYLMTTFGEVYVSPVGEIKLTKLNIPEDAKNNYPYVSSVKGGSTESNFVDILLLGADRKFFEEGKITNYYVRIPKIFFKGI